MMNFTEFENLITQEADRQVCESAEYVKAWNEFQNLLKDLSDKGIDTGDLDDAASALSTAATDAAFKLGFRHAISIMK